MRQSPANPFPLHGIKQEEITIDDLTRENYILKAMNKRKSEFLSLAVHDMVNPLSCIIGMLEEIMLMTEEGITALSDLRPHIFSVHSATEKLLSIVNDLRVICSSDKRLIEMEYSSCNMNDMIRECVSMFSPVAKRKNITLIFEENKTLPDVQLDKKKILSVIENLVSNAIKYSFPENRIIISSQLSKNCIIVSCQDFGQGFSDEEMHDVFRHCKKFSAKPTANETSTGLGLMIVKKFISMHKGKVWLQSSKGEGSVFYFSVPLRINKHGSPESMRQ